MLFTEQPLPSIFFFLLSGLKVRALTNKILSTVIFTDESKEQTKLKHPSIFAYILEVYSITINYLHYISEVNKLIS